MCCLCVSVSSERDWLRVVVLSHLSEPLESLSTQLCLCTAQMAKYDAGRQWPQLLPTLLSGLSSGDRVCCLRYTFAVHCVVKQLQSVKTPQGRHTFAAVTATAAPHIASQCRQHTERLCELVSAQEPPLLCERPARLASHSLNCLLVLVQLSHSNGVITEGRSVTSHPVSMVRAK